jgi:cytochrome c oxidase assembly protein subunit 15
VQFDHRILAYAIWVAVLVHAYDAKSKSALTLAAMASLQVVLGIATLLMQAPLALALTHQLLAIVVFTVAVVHAEHLCHRPPVAAALAGATA